MAERVMLTSNFNEKKSIQRCIIYLNADKSSFRTIQPQPGFNGDWKGLVEAITDSNLKEGIKNYHSFELV